MASKAGTELSLRLPKESVGIFALLFETLDAQLGGLKIKVAISIDEQMNS